MKIRFHTMSGTLHSWSLTIQHMARAMKKAGHDVFVRSTNNLQHFPEDLRPHLLPGYQGQFDKDNPKPVDFLTPEGQVISVEDPRRGPADIPDPNMPYDLEFAYTVPLQYPRRFEASSRCRMAIWNFESSILPPGWHLYPRAIDYLLPSSQYSYDIFARNGVPKEKMLVVPHGVDTNIFNPCIPPFKLKTEKKVKFLLNAIPHARKLHDRVFRAYCDAFSGNDDVCLVLKTKFLVPKDPVRKPFEVNVEEMLEKEFGRRRNPPEIEVINDVFIDDIGSLYTACDCVVCMSSCEGFWLPGLEAMACGSLVIAPRHGGQLDFLNDGNSLLVNTKEMTAPLTHQYWKADPKAVVGDPDTRHCAELMRRVYDNLATEKARVRDAARRTADEFSWERAANMVLELPIPETSARIPQKRRILYIIPYMMAGGAEVWIREAVRKLDRRLYEPHIALVHGADPGLRKLLEGLDAVIEDLSKQGRGAALQTMIESGTYALIHFYNSYGVYDVLRQVWREGYRCRIVETVHSDLAWNDSMTKVSARSEMICAIAAISNNMAKKMLKLGNKNVFVLPQHIDWDRFLAVRKSRDVLDELGIPQGYVVGFVGRLSPEKNIPVILKCAQMLPEVSFVLVGDGPQRQPLTQMAAQLKNVFFAGARNDVDRFYGAFDALILPSDVEGLPLVILEAMSAGVPVIASDVGAVSEAVIDGMSGIVVWNPRDPSLFARAIVRLRNEPGLKERCAENARNMAVAMKGKSDRDDINRFYAMLFQQKSGWK